MSLQEALKLLRMELGLTQESLAKKLNKAFITVNRWENGKGFPSRSNARAILDIAQNENASKDCIAYLNEVLLPDAKRNTSASSYGFPDIDREFMFQLADGSKNALYVIEAGNYHLIYANRKAESQAIQYLRDEGIYTDDRKLKEQEDKRCFHFFGNRNTPCPFCPLKKFNSNDYKDIVVTNLENGRQMLVRAKASEVNKKHVYIIYLTEISNPGVTQSNRGVNLNSIEPEAYLNTRTTDRYADLEMINI